MEESRIHKYFPKLSLESQNTSSEATEEEVKYTSTADDTGNLDTGESQEQKARWDNYFSAFVEQWVSDRGYNNQDDDSEYSMCATCNRGGPQFHYLKVGKNITKR